MSDRRRLAIVAGTTFALVMAGASVVGARSPQVDLFGDASAYGAELHGPGFGDFGGRGIRGRGFGGGLRELGRGLGILDGDLALVRQELILDEGEDGIVTRRVEHGTVTDAADGTITVALATGEAATVTTDEDTAVIEVDTTQRPYLSEGELADVTAGDDVVVWSESQEDGPFLAGRVVILPADAAEASDDASSGASAAPAA